ncbi:MAG: hypothetical protein SWO11_20315, partial [Thermodesulfobacteriota bacterium]|nr:hypothetical protein [Thermodesulfobacteriota bacterium]
MNAKFFIVRKNRYWRSIFTHLSYKFYLFLYIQNLGHFSIKVKITRFHVIANFIWSDIAFFQYFGNSLSINLQIKIEEIKRYIRDAERRSDQIRRRGINGEKISHSEKVFS